MSNDHATDSRMPLGRLLVEAALIVTSILLAFGIEAWWDGHRDREEEGRVLMGLEAEFRQHVATLEGYTERSNAALRRLRYLLDGELRGVGEVPDDSLDMAFWDLMWAPTFDPGSGTRDALISSGRLELLQSEELRDRLAAWQGVVDELRDNQLAVRGYVVDTLVPFLSAQAIPLARPLSNCSCWNVHPAAPSEARTPPRLPDLTQDLISRYRRTTSDPEFQGLLAYRYFWEAASSSEARDALAAANEILAMLAEESD